MKKLVNNFLVMFMMITILSLPNLVKAEELYLNKDELEVVSQDTKYYKTVTTKNLFATYGTESQDEVVTYEITKEEYDNFHPATANGLRSIHSVETTYKQMVTTLYKNGDTFYAENYLNWKNFPSTRSYDIIGIGFSSNVKAVSQLQFNQEYCDMYGSCTNARNGNPFVFTYGAAMMFPLPTVELSRLNQTFWFDLGKNTTGSVIGFNLFGDYAHAQQTVTFNQACQFEMDFDRISFNNTTVKNKYDEISSTSMSWSGTW